MTSLALGAAASVWAVGGAGGAGTPADSGAVRVDSHKVVGADTCVKCHAGEVEQWRQTPHFATFDELHRKPEAKAIADRLGLRSVKRNDQCTQCHYTTQTVEGRDRVVSGISCESCHGAAQDWLQLHADYGGPGVTRESESAEHRSLRVERSMAAGMNNPANLYLVARQCLACHTSPNERLVNVGGHATGSGEFELVAWSQGRVRHNFLRTGGAANAPSPPERLRVMYVVGVLADLEASLRATSLATERAPYGIAAARRGAQRKRDLYRISQLIDNPHVQRALDAALGVRLKLNNRDALMGAAAEISDAAFRFAEESDGAELGALDPLLPTQFK
ncbi:MAG TPA: cytochrome c family protein [Lacipirellulaceae bacterium]|nr:cytochrome c family protein [Lacipirellulaceae bacterium]